MNEKFLLWVKGSFSGDSFESLKVENFEVLKILCLIKLQNKLSLTFAFVLK